MSEPRERFRRALDKLQFAHGEWARTKADHPEQDRNRLADAAVAAENDVMGLYDDAARVAAGAGDPPGEHNFLRPGNLCPDHSEPLMLLCAECVQAAGDRPALTVEQLTVILNQYRFSNAYSADWGADLAKWLLPFLTLGDRPPAPSEPTIGGNVSDTMTPVAKDDPRWLAWQQYVRTPDFGNTRSWPVKGPEYIDGALWAAFLVGWEACGAIRPTPAMIAEVEAFLERSQDISPLARHYLVALLGALRAALTIQDDK